MVAGLLVFYSYNFLRVLPEGNYWPTGAPEFLQSAFRGPHSVFPVIPWLGFTMFGAMIGALLHDLHKIVHNWYFPLFFFLFGGLSYFFPKDILFGIDNAMMSLFEMRTQFVYVDWIFIKLGMVIMILGGLIIIDQRFGKHIPDSSLFIKIGQNTLTIYVLHMVVLYGSVTGIGLNDYFHKVLGPWEVTIGAILFVGFFIVLVKYIDQIRKSLGFILQPIRKGMNKLFGTSGNN
jgi:hypothetical protein